MKSIVDMMIEKDYQNELLDQYQKETGKEPVPEEGGHTDDFERWFVEKCEEAEKAGYKDAEGALEYIKTKNLKAFDPNLPKYYVLVEEWLYPTESGRDFVEDCDTIEEAVEIATEKCVEEVYNFAHNCKCDPTTPSTVEEGGKAVGVIITDKNGMEDWWYAVKIVEVEHGFHT